jgi:hypothetical protein
MRNQIDPIATAKRPFSLIKTKQMFYDDETRRLKTAFSRREIDEAADEKFMGSSELIPFS